MNEEVRREEWVSNVTKIRTADDLWKSNRILKQLMPIDIIWAHTHTQLWDKYEKGRGRRKNDTAQVYMSASRSSLC